MQRTPLYQYHKDHGARFVDFAGWEMPILYTSIHEEHRRVRGSAGLFDVSHMGRFKIAGKDARTLLEIVLTRRVSDMKPGRCRYSLVCNEAGGTMDDVLVYRYEDYWLLVVNASNREKIFGHLESVSRGRSMQVSVQDMTMASAMVAIQGPGVMPHVQRLSREVTGLKRYQFCTKQLLTLKMTISRTGYTGEDGVELIFPAGAASMALSLLLNQALGDLDLKPVGLGARDTLRMEAGMPLYGHELDEETDPISAGLGFAVSLDKPGLLEGVSFVGQRALARISAEGAARKLVGIELEGRRTARQGMTVMAGGEQVGLVTSGCVSPTLERPIAMAYLKRDLAEVGRVVTVEVGSTGVKGKVVALPFYKAT